MIADLDGNNFMLPATQFPGSGQRDLQPGCFDRDNKTTSWIEPWIQIAHQTTSIIKMLLVLVSLLLNCLMPSERQLSQQLRNDKLRHKNIIQMIIWTSMKNVDVANDVKMRDAIPNRHFNTLYLHRLCIISIFDCSQRAWTPLQYKDHLSRHRDPTYVAKDTGSVHIVKQHAYIDEITKALETTSIRHRSDTFVSDRCSIDVDFWTNIRLVLAMWVVIILFVGPVINGCLVFLSEARTPIVGSPGCGMTLRDGGMYNKAIQFNLR